MVKIGGKDYTEEDLRRDIIKIEVEDEMWRQSCIQRKRLREGQDWNITDMDQTHNSSQRKEDLEVLAGKVYKELEKEELNDSRQSSSMSPQGQITIQQNLGIQENQEGISSPRYGRVKGKRGRKSLKELREVEGLCKEQIKIDNLFNIGKGKGLPKVP